MSWYMTLAFVWFCAMMVIAIHFEIKRKGWRRELPKKPSSMNNG